MMAKSAQNEVRRRDFEASQQRLASSGRKRIAAEVFLLLIDVVAKPLGEG
jgi:hypothetical protein